MKPEKINLLTLIDEKGVKHVVFPGKGVREIEGLGVFDTDRLLTVKTGSRITVASKEYSVLECSLYDIIENIKRGPQWITPKDSAQIVVGCGIGPGDRILEVGTGTGALTVVMAHFVGPGGEVVTYERNQQTAKLAKRNITMAGLEERVEVRTGDGADCDETEYYDSVVTDVPEPWSLLPQLTSALRPSRYICAYVPTMNQAERIIKAMREIGYAEVRAVENLQREIVVGEGGTRPSFEMLGHTGYLCFGRKITR